MTGRAYFILFITLILCSYNRVHAQCSSWSYFAARDTVGYSTADGIAIDENNNSYTCGIFNGQITFGSNTTLTTANNSNFFIAAYGPSGFFKWAGAFSSNYFYPYVKMVYANNAIYVFGATGNTIYQGSTVVATNSISQSGPFIIKLDLSGNVIWGQIINCTLQSNGIALTADSAGNVFISGQFTGTLSFTGLPALTAPQSSTGTSFVAKINAAGTPVWALQSQLVNPYNPFDFASGVKADKNDNVFISGLYTDSISFGKAALTNLYTYFNGTGFYLAKFDSGGNNIWLTGVLSSQNISLYPASQIDNAGNTYFGFDLGSFKDSVTISGTVYAGRNGKLILIKYDENGTVVWVRQAASRTSPNIENVPVALIVDNDNKLNVIGPTTDTLYFGNQLYVNPYDFFIARYDESGTFEDVSFAGGKKRDLGSDVFDANIDANNSLYICGNTFDDTLYLGTQTVTSNYSSDTTGRIAAFIWKRCELASGINPVVVSGGMNAFPNPSSSIITLSGVSDNSLMELVDLTGRILISRTLGANHTLDISGLPAGIYIMKTNSGVRKVVKI